VRVWFNTQISHRVCAFQFIVIKTYQQALNFLSICLLRNTASQMEEKKARLHNKNQMISFNSGYENGVLFNTDFRGMKLRRNQ